MGRNNVYSSRLSPMKDLSKEKSEIMLSTDAHAMGITTKTGNGDHAGIFIAVR